MAEENLKIGIGLDNYKQKSFRKALKKAGFTWEEMEGATKDSKFWQVQCPKNRLDELTKVIRTANTLAQRMN